jgi:hypothetical protein
LGRARPERRDQIAWTQTALLTGEFATAESAKLRCRLLHVAARITPRATPRLRPYRPVI